MEIDENSVGTSSTNMILADGNYDQRCSCIIDESFDDMKDDIDHMVATYSRLKDIAPDIAARVLLDGDIFDDWRKRYLNIK